MIEQGATKAWLLRTACGFPSAAAPAIYAHNVPGRSSPKPCACYLTSTTLTVSLAADPNARVIIDQYTSQLEGGVVTYGIDSPAADVYAQRVILTTMITKINIRTPLGIIPIESPLIGRSNVYNILAAVAAGCALELPLKVILLACNCLAVRNAKLQLLTSRFANRQMACLLKSDCSMLVR